MQRIGRVQHVAANSRMGVLGLPSPLHTNVPFRFASTRSTRSAARRPSAHYQQPPRNVARVQAPVNAANTTEKQDIEEIELPPGIEVEPKEKRVALNTLDQRQLRGFLITWTIGGAIALYCAYLFVGYRRPVENPRIKELSEQKDVSAVYDDTADSFDSEVAFQEWSMRVNSIRRALSLQCKGHVLEVSCGTGRNLGYYDVLSDGPVDSLTLVDLSPQMIDVCKRKYETLRSSYLTSWIPWARPMKRDLPVRFLPASALGELPLAPTDYPKKYDTIIQTMGLCSTPSPVELIVNMAKYLDTKNPEARILLLEHGRSYREWLNKILDNSAEHHADKHGCWWNRDIEALVEEAANKAGLEVVREKRKHLGTTYLFELKPKEGFAQQVLPSSEETTKSVADAEKQPAEKQLSGWFSWFGK